ncbi:hypothetical protein ABEB36_003207 [Hypothenemus hampei]|uniref:Non-lysosomal glucosylceramidase n=1 Tax=Hypothenemus hampei TaxID=57062 RepID=A0ABD1F8E1_HYPHA
MEFQAKNAIPKYGFKVKLNHEYPERRSPHFRPSLKIIWTMLPLLFRYIWYYIVYTFKRKSVVMDYILMETAKRIYGVPIGGIGSGTIGRGFKGEFCRFQLRPNICEYNTVDADDFIITIKDKNHKTIFQSCLSTYKKTSLTSWKSNLNPDKCNYTGLYPRAWIEYDLSDYGIFLICRQTSPVIPHDYESSCLPCSVFVWNIQNITNEDRFVTISFMFKNGTGSKKLDKQATTSSKGFYYQNCEGVILYHSLDKMQCSYTIACKTNENVNISKCLEFNPKSDGSDVWNQLEEEGQFDKTKEKSHKTRHNFGEIGIGVAAYSKILGNSSQAIEMALVWDMPSILFTEDDKRHFRYYTEKFGKENAALKIVHFALQNYPSWEEKIYNWQKPVLEDSSLPDWYKSAIFNECYFISDGGTVWLALDEDLKTSLKDHDPRKKYGRFAYLEGHEYRMYNSYDVHFYASHALSKNWPLIQQSLHYDLKDFIFTEVPEKIEELYNGKIIERKKPDTVPHDAGNPGECPFNLINAYPIHDVSNWRDLGTKFVLQTFRDATTSGQMDTNIVKDMYQACDIIMRKLLEFDLDNDGLIENSGTPDQTYDTWVMTGTSSYCGGLWLAALYVMIKMASALEIIEDQEFYQDLLDRARQSFDKKLWNGKYYNFDCSKDQKSSIMADQLNGFWYLNCIGLNLDIYKIIPKSKIQSALKEIYNNNVLKFCQGTMGAVNGFINGQSNKICVQSQEVWTGVTYALAAMMIQEGLIEEGFKTAEGMFRSMTEKFGLIFDTPEALYDKSCYRAIGYMRPLSIWSMQLAWESRKSLK